MYRHMSVFSDEKVSKDYLHAHLENDELLMVAYERAMAEKDFAMAIHYAETALKRHGNTCSDYEKRLIDALMANRDYEQAKPYLRKHVLEGDSKAYRTYVSLFEGKDKETEIDHLLEDFMESSGMATLFKIVAVEESRLEQLMRYVETYPYAVVDACDVLVEGFRQRVYRIFEHLILKEAMNASDRRGYRAIARIIYKAKQVLGDDADTFAFDLIHLYPLKRALKDELRKNSGVDNL